MVTLRDQESVCDPWMFAVSVPYMNILLLMIICGGSSPNMLLYHDGNWDETKKKEE
jgi:hypothetical protein